MANAVTITWNPAQFSGKNLSAAIKEKMWEGSPELGMSLEEFVRARTPILSGALQESTTYELGDNSGDMVSDEVMLVKVYYNDDQQLGEYNRVYAQYQEGPELGMDTFTNPPRQMLTITSETDGLAYVEEWAYKKTEEAVHSVCKP